MNQDQTMTGAELQTMREGCNLSREELGDLVGVQARTVKHWENGRAGVPGDVQARIIELDEAAHSEAVTHLASLTTQALQRPAGPLVLVRYRDAALMPAGFAYAIKRGAPSAASLHGAAIGRARVEYKGPAAQAPRVVWFDPESFTTWTLARSLPDTLANRTEWAAQELGAQAIPHRADQPPA